MLAVVTEEELAFYAVPGPLTALGTDSARLDVVSDPAEVARLLHGFVVHEGWAPIYGLEIPAERRQEVQVRPAADMIARACQLDPRPLRESRPPERRLVGICRDFSVLACAMLRHAGVPARARCGFATYFEPDRFIDHWVVEHWDAAGKRWTRLDAQLDDKQRQALALDFDPADVPQDRFLSGGEAWRLCRAGGADPARFGVDRWWGAWFIRNNVVRDLAALNKVELLPWDRWGLMDERSPLGGGSVDHLVDEAAALTVAGDWPAFRRLYEQDDRLHAPIPWPG